AGAVNLQHALTLREIPGRGNLFDDRFDVGAEKFERSIAGLADEVEMARVTVRVLEPEAPFSEINLARDARIHHPLQRAVDGRPADAMVLSPQEIDQI